MHHKHSAIAVESCPFPNSHFRGAREASPKSHATRNTGPACRQQAGLVPSPPKGFPSLLPCPFPAQRCREMPSCRSHLSPCHPILMQVPWGPKQASKQAQPAWPKESWHMGLLLPAPALHPRTPTSPQTCRRLKRERAGTHQVLSNNLADRKTTGSEGAAQPLSFPDKAREVVAKSP